MFRQFKNLLKNTGPATALRDNCSGSVVTLFVFSFMAFALSAGAVLDVTRINRLKSVMADALDAAILAAGNDLSNGMSVNAEFRQNFENFFYANVIPRAGGGTNFSITSFSADEATGEISATVSGDLEMTLMKFAGYNTMTFETGAAGVFSNTDVEIAMMLDVTGSMRPNGKLNALKLAATDAINILMPQSGTQGIRIGLVPYSYSVNAGNYAYPATAGGSTSFCVTERGGAEAFTDASHLVQPVGADARAICPSGRIQPLTDNKSNLISDIGRLRAEGYTAGHLGIAWSYYMLSENWQPLWPAASDPAPYSEDVRKVAILMTDGIFNTYYDGTDPELQAWGPYADQSDAASIALCNDMKAQKAGEPGITVYAVAFQAPAAAEATLRACANPDTATEIYYYSASSAQELRTAFRAIAGSIKSLRLTQ